MTSEHPSTRVVGQRLADARKFRGITQEMAAGHLGLSRPTFIAIEKGARAAKPGEIVKLASLYAQPVHRFVRESAPMLAFTPHFRAAVEKAKPAEAEPLETAIGEFQAFVEDYLDLERRMKAPMRPNDPPPLDLNPRVNALDLAEDVAGRERRRLGLGDQPIPNIRGMLESEVGVRIFLGRMPTTIAGMTLFADGPGACMLINGIHPAEARRASIALGYARLIVDRHSAVIDRVAAAGRKSANERFAEAFATSFLMPASSVRLRFNEVIDRTGNFRVADLVELRQFYSVSLEAMALRLEALGLVRSGTWNLLKEKALRVGDEDEPLGRNAEINREPAYPERYKFLAVHAHERGELTEKELANYLRCDVWEARQVIRESMISVEVDSEGRARPMVADFETSLLAEPR